MESGCRVIECREGLSSEDEFLEAMKDADALLVGSKQITAETMDLAPSLKVIAKHGTGTDNIDIDAAKARGISVVNAPAANNEAVAEHAFALMMSLARRIPEAHLSVLNGKWERFLGRAIWGKTIAIIGLGHIGQAFAQRCYGFGMKMLAYDLVWPEEFAAKLGIEFRPWPSIMGEADFISLHLPLNEETEHMVTRDVLSMVKPGALLINTARGAIIDEEALYEALKSRLLAGAALDVLSHEPPLGSPLLGLSNVILTPHIGSYTVDSLEAVGRTVAEQIISILRKEE